MAAVSKNRLIVLVGLVVAGLMLAGYALMVHPHKSRQNASLVKESVALEEAATIMRRETEALRQAAAKATEKGLPVYPRSTDRFREGAAEILAGVDRLVRTTGVALVRLEPQPPEEQPPLLVHPFLVEVRGSFHQVCAFLEGLEEELLLVPALFSIEGGGKSGEALRASFRLKAHQWAGQRLDPRPGKGTRDLALSPTGGRDPFAPPGAGAPLERAKTQGVVLTGILFLGGKPKAIIDGKAYSQGDMVGGKRILSISQEEVVLEGDSRPLRIERPIRRVGPP